jgi:transposase
VVDNAGWHTAKRLAVPANVRLHFLPPCTPELQPVEPFWPLVREAVANDTFARLADLRRRVVRRCLRSATDQATVKGAIGFHWKNRRCFGVHLGHVIGVDDGPKFVVDQFIG